MVSGALGEAAVLKELIKQEYTVFTQFDGASPFDLVAYKNNILYRVSVKSTSVLRGISWRVDLRQKGRNATQIRYKPFDKTSCDILAVYIIPEDRVVFIESNFITNTREINIR